MFGRKQGSVESKEAMEEAPQTVKQQHEAPEQKTTVSWAPASQAKMMDAAIGSFEWHAYMVSGFMKQPTNRPKIAKIVSVMETTLDRVYMMMMEESRLFMPRDAGSAIPSNMETKWLVHMARFIDWMLFLHKSAQAAFPKTPSPEPARQGYQPIPDERPRSVADQKPGGTDDQRIGVDNWLREDVRNAILEKVVANNKGAVDLLAQIISPEHFAEAMLQEYEKAVDVATGSGLRPLQAEEGVALIDRYLSTWLQENLLVLQGLKAGAETADAGVTL